MPEKRKSVKQMKKQSPSTLSSKSAVVDKPEFRAYSTRDVLYESKSGISSNKTLRVAAGYEMKQTERETTIEQMYKDLEIELRTLHDEATQKHDMVALHCLHNIAFESTRQLMLSCMANPSMAAEIAQHREAWPCLCGTDNTTKEASTTYLKILNLGSQKNDVYSTRKLLSKRTQARAWLAALVGLMARLGEVANTVGQIDQVSERSDQAREICRSIMLNPDLVAHLKTLFKVENPFTKDETLRKFINSSICLPKLGPDEKVVEAWMTVIRDLMTDVYDGHPENSPLRENGYYLARGKQDSSPEGTPSFESNVRSGMFAQLRKALMTIAKS